MFNTNDITRRVGEKLLERDYYSLNNEERKEIINEELINYAILKAKEIDTEFECDIKNVELPYLIEYIHNSNIQRKNNAIEGFTHYVRQIMSELQEIPFLWFIEDDKEYVKSPLIKVAIDKQVTGMTTHMDTNTVQTFNHVYDYFMNGFMYEKNKKYIVKEIEFKQID